jgi:hypothetical protein
VTEAEWLACSDPEKMLEFLRWKVSERKLRLFACACCRKFWSRLGDRRARSAIEVAELFVDGLAPLSALSAAYREFSDAERRTLHFDDALQLAAVGTALWKTSFALPGVVVGGFETALTACRVSTEGVESLTLLRDMVGNPFRPIAISPSVLAWSEVTVVRLAQASYKERLLPAGTLDYGRLAVLADALEEAGCTSEDILGHLRGPGPHVRGCWVVDIVLGKS